MVGFFWLFIILLSDLPTSGFSLLKRIFALSLVLPKILSFENENKNLFFFCILLTYSYLCPRLLLIITTAATTSYVVAAVVIVSLH